MHFMQQIKEDFHPFLSLLFNAYKTFSIECKNMELFLNCLIILRNSTWASVFYRKWFMWNIFLWINNTMITQIIRRLIAGFLPSRHHNGIVSFKLPGKGGHRAHLTINRLYRKELCRRKRALFAFQMNRGAARTQSQWSRGREVEFAMSSRLLMSRIGVTRIP